MDQRDKQMWWTTAAWRRPWRGWWASVWRRTRPILPMHIIRGENSGVFFGEIMSRNGREVEIRNCRRLWYWDGAASLSQMANEGVKQPENCKFTVTVERITVLDAIEILDCTEAAQENIMGVPEWRR